MLEAAADSVIYPFSHGSRAAAGPALGLPSPESALYRLSRHNPVSFDRWVMPTRDGSQRLGEFRNAGLS